MSIKIEKISVKYLFNKFHYELDLKKDTRDVSILIGPNGCGKTTIFNILDFIFTAEDISFIALECLPNTDM